MRVQEGDDKYNCILENRRLLNIKISCAQRELVFNSNSLESELKFFMNKCCTIQEVN